jgi:hypothetical protein
MSEEIEKCEWEVGHAASDILMEGKSLLFSTKRSESGAGEMQQTLVKKQGRSGMGTGKRQRRVLWRPLRRRYLPY